MNTFQNTKFAFHRSDKVDIKINNKTVGVLPTFLTRLFSLTCFSSILLLQNSLWSWTFGELSSAETSSNCAASDWLQARSYPEEGAGVRDGGQREGSVEWAARPSLPPRQGPPRHQSDSGQRDLTDMQLPGRNDAHRVGWSLGPLFSAIFFFSFLAIVTFKKTKQQCAAVLMLWIIATK